MIQTGNISSPSWSAGAVIAAEGRRGRGAVLNGSGRFETQLRDRFDDGWQDQAPDPLKTTVEKEEARSIITRNMSPDIPFDRSINPYRGCEHGCSYCFARPSHAYLGLSPGLDFESKLFAKVNAADLLRRELAAKGYDPRPIAIGTNTDPYQPIERDYRLMRGILEELLAARHPVTIVTKSALILRDIDLLSALAAQNLVKVSLSLTTLDPKLSRSMEPRASAPARRLTALKMLSDAGVPTGVMVAPVIPGLNDHEIENILKAARAAGAEEAGYILVRLPGEVAPLFTEWLKTHVPDRASRVLNLLASMRGGKLNDPRFHGRFKGDGAMADLLRRRFAVTSARLGFNGEKRTLDRSQFTRPRAPSAQLDLFC